MVGAFDHIMAGQGRETPAAAETPAVVPYQRYWERVGASSPEVPAADPMVQMAVPFFRERRSGGGTTAPICCQDNECRGPGCPDIHTRDEGRKSKGSEPRTRFRSTLFSWGPEVVVEVERIRGLGCPKPDALDILVICGSDPYGMGLGEITLMAIYGFCAYGFRATTLLHRCWPWSHE